MGGLLNRPIAGTLMGALALSTSLASGNTPSASYYETDPGVSAAPANKAILGGAPGSVVDPFANDGGPGCYIMRVPDHVRGMRLRAWGASGKAHSTSSDSSPPASGGLIQADFRVVPGELLFVIIGVEGGTLSSTGTYASETLWDNVDALGGPGLFSRSDNRMAGGGYTGVFRLNADIIRDFNIGAPANGAMFARYLYRDRVAALLALATPLLIGGAGGGPQGGNTSFGGRGGFPNGEQRQSAPINGGGGTQTSGGVAGVAAGTNGSPGTKFKGGAQVNSNAGSGGGGWYGGGGGAYQSSSQYGGGGGGSSFVDPKLGFNPTAPQYGYPEETDAPPVTGTGNTYRRQGRLVALWDTPT